MKLYRVTLKHDNGTAEIIVSADSMEDAKRRTMAAEGCPERAIISVWRHVTGATEQTSAQHYGERLRRPLSGGNRKTVRAFIAEHRKEIDAAIKRVVPNARLNDEERRKWILNDEGLYLWARSEGVRI